MAQKITPMRKQYLEMKEKCPDCLLFFRLGDFYEMFDEDARIASKVLDLTLTTRDRNKDIPQEEKVPMCGVPYHSYQSYLARLVAKGYNCLLYTSSSRTLHTSSRWTDRSRRTCSAGRCPSGELPAHKRRPARLPCAVPRG